MAQRRMVSPQIVNTDAFLDMPVSSQALYFHLLLRADDDGFITPKVVMRMIGASQDDLKVLITKRFVLTFESGVVVIKHWLIHNLIRADMYRETAYIKEKETLGLNEYGAYTELREGVDELQKIEPPLWLKKRRGEVCTANGTQTVPRLGKDRLGKDSINTTSVVSGEAKKTYGEHKNVLLTDEEHQKLAEQMTAAVRDDLIEQLGRYIKSKGKRYKSHYATIQAWQRKREDTTKGKAKSVTFIG